MKAVMRLLQTLKKILKRSDPILLLLCVGTTLFGLVLIASATNFRDNSMRYVAVQGAAMVIGIVLYCIFADIDMEHFAKRWWIFLVFNLGFIALLIPFGAVRNNSRFASNAVSENGAIGLMQLTPERFEWICINLLGGDTMDAGMLFDPDTNLSAGCAYVSYLYDRYGIWEHVFAAYHTDPTTVDAWLSDPQNLSNQGVLQKYPNRSTQTYVNDMSNTVSFYSKLYYQS